MALNAEQQQALDVLMQLLPEKPAQERQSPDWLQTWLGISSEQVLEAVRQMLAQKKRFEERLLDWADSNPMDAAFEFIAVAAWAFYQVEKGYNPKIKTYIDAFYYIATSASVGYADIFAVTQPGRAIVSLVMIVGPALTSRSLTKPSHKS